jgi:thiamine pyrophosphate-dependent acetolactate synthase large subunit-like protein
MSIAIPKITLQRRPVVTKILDSRKDELLITGLGAPTWDVASVSDHPNNFYLWGGMGGAVSTGLGLALAKPERRVLVFTGDGEMLMGMGSLATVAVQKPKNFAVIVLDNERYGETGMQKTATASGVDLSLVARGVGFHIARTIWTEDELSEATNEIYSAHGPVFYNIKVQPSDDPMVLPEKDGLTMKHRFKEQLLGRKNYKV